MKTLISLLLKLLGSVGPLIAGLLVPATLAEIRRLQPKVTEYMTELRDRTDLTGQQKAEAVLQKTKYYFSTELGQRVQTTDILNVIQLVYTRWSQR